MIDEQTEYALDVAKKSYGAMKDNALNVLLKTMQSHKSVTENTSTRYIGSGKDAKMHRCESKVSVIGAGNVRHHSDISRAQYVEQEATSIIKRTMHILDLLLNVGGVTIRHWKV